jgi:hypothetical protein
VNNLMRVLRAGAEVKAALRAGPFEPAPPPDDAPAPGAIPSIAAGRREDRVLAEIDQDGFAFAVDPLDEAYFNRRAQRTKRQHNLLDVTLVAGRVCVRKRFRIYPNGARAWGHRPVSAYELASRALWASLRLYLYSEAAALLRLRDLPFVPKLRAVDPRDCSISLDYVQGENLRAVAARGGAPVFDGDLARVPELRRLSGDDLQRREVALLQATAGGGFRAEIASMTREVNARGVAPLDIKLGNFIRGDSGRLYWIDFEIAGLSSEACWQPDLAEQHRTIEELFGLSGPA